MDQLSQRIEQLTPLQKAVFALKETRARLDTLERAKSEPIAIVGMACRFPGGADRPDAFWRLLCDGVDAITEIPPQRWNADEFYDPDPQAPGKLNTRQGGFIDHIEEFDNVFFGISEREAPHLDPQQRLLLELGYEALEDAGIPSEQLRGSRTGVFVGISLSDYGIMLYQRGISDGFVATGNHLSVAANRLSFTFDFRGPSVALDTACSSSLVAVHLACQSIRSGESQLALVGGANVVLSPYPSIDLTKAGFSSPSGRCRSFDAGADGYVRSEGGGMVVLKPLARALADGDSIYAVIRGSAVGQDGQSNGLTAPNRQAQQAVLRAAYQQAKVSPGMIQFVETQGTGTLLGDAIEALALGNVLSEDRPPGSICALGSVKTNLGHLEAASGMASLIKTALALKHRQLPPNLHFQTPNPSIPLDTLPLRVQQALEPWPTVAGPGTVRSTLLAGVSAFGFGGTLAHVVLEEAPTMLRPVPGTTASPALGAAGATPGLRQTALADRTYLIPLSARSENALQDLARAFADYLSDGAVSLDDLCYTAALRRNHYDHRLALTARSCGEARELLAAFGRGEILPGVATGHVRSRDAEVPDPASLEREDRPDAGLHDVLGTLYVRGHRIDWQRSYNRGGTCLRLPTYPWQRQRFWIDPQAPAAAGGWPEAAGQALGWMDSGPVRKRADLNLPYVAPQTELERHVADLWAKTLHIDRVGVHDNFLELGGNSLQAAALSNRLQQQIGVTLSPVALFETQTIHDLAAYLDREYPAAVAQLLSTADRPLPTADCPLPTADCPLPTADRPLPTAVPSLSQGQDTVALLAQLAELSDGEVDALLQQSLADREKDDA